MPATSRRDVGCWEHDSRAWPAPPLPFAHEPSFLVAYCPVRKVKNPLPRLSAPSAAQ